MRKNGLMRLIALGALAGVCLYPEAVKAAELNTGDFIAACSKDPVITDDLAFDDGKVTPKAYCECIAAELGKSDFGQKDVDMLIKMHKEDITDADVENYPALDDLMIANEGFEDKCRAALGLPTDTGTDVEEFSDEEMMREDDAMPEEDSPEDGGAPPAEDDEAPPE